MLCLPFPSSRMWLTAVGVFFVTMAIFIVFFYAQMFVKAHGAAPVVGTYAVSSQYIFFFSSPALNRTSCPS